MKNYLEKNLNAINDEFKKNVEGAEKPEWFIATKSKNNDISFSISKTNKIHYGHDEKSPRKYGRDICRKNKLKQTEAGILVGIGVGHTAAHIMKNSQTGFTLIIIEPELFLIKEAFTQYDFSSYIKNKKMFIATSIDDVAVLIQYAEAVEVVENWHFYVENYVQHLPDIYTKIAANVSATLNAIRCNTGTMMGAGATIAYNDITNLPHLIKYPGVASLKDKHKGMPAVVVSTGPSLKKNIHLLLDKKIQNNTIIICVAQAIRILLAYGIKPDFACTVDYGAVNISHFEGLENCGIPLVALNRTYHKIFTTWESPVFVATSISQPRESITDVWRDRGGVEQGGSVSHFAVGLAIHLGCSKAALIGQDLSYSEDMRSHNSNADSSGKLEIIDNHIKWIINDPRSPLYNQVHDMGYAVAVPGYFGGNVITNVGLASFIHTFEVLATLYEKTTLYNCTEGGVSIKNFKHCTLNSYLKRFSKIKKKKISLETENTTWKNDIETALRFCVADVAVLDSVINNANDAKEATEKMGEFIGFPKTKEFDNLGKENYSLSVAAQKAAAKNPLLEMAIYKASREIAGDDMYVSGKRVSKDDDVLKKRITRNLHILQAAIDEAEKLKGYYETTEKNLKTVQSGKLLESEPKKEYSTVDIKEYIEIGNWALPMLAVKNTKGIEFELIEKLNQMKMDDIQIGVDYQADWIEHEKKIQLMILQKAAKEAGTKKEFRKSLLCLLRANAIESDNQYTVYGLAATNAMLGNYEKAIKYYNKLVELMPDSTRPIYERALCVLNVDIDKGFEQLQNLMSTTDEYDSVLLDIAVLFYKKNEVEKAIEILDLYMQKIENNPDAFKLKYEWESEKGNELESEKYKKQYLRMVR